MPGWLQTVLAVVLGGALTYAGQFALDAKRESREIAREQRQDIRLEVADATLAARASRLVLLDALAIVTLLRASLDTGRWWTEMRLPTEAWREYAAQLCGALNDDQFRRVGAPFAVAESFNAIIAAAHRYWLVAPHIKLAADKGPGAMRDELLSGIGGAMSVLLELALPTVAHDDPLYKLVTDAQGRR